LEATSHLYCRLGGSVVLKHLSPNSSCNGCFLTALYLPLWIPGARLGDSILSNYSIFAQREKLDCVDPVFAAGKVAIALSSVYTGDGEAITQRPHSDTNTPAFG